MFPMVTPPKLSFACPLPWQNMTGSERAKFCEQCGHHVANFSLLTADERKALLQRAPETDARKSRGGAAARGDIHGSRGRRRDPRGAAYSRGRRAGTRGLAPRSRAGGIAKGAISRATSRMRPAGASGVVIGRLLGSKADAMMRLPIANEKLSCS